MPPPRGSREPPDPEAAGESPASCDAAAATPRRSGKLRLPRLARSSSDEAPVDETCRTAGSAVTGVLTVRHAEAEISVATL